MSFTGKVVIVTGASSGIGAATAIQFAAEGANVAMVGRNENKLKNVSEKCEKSGNKPLVIVADMTKDEDVKRIIKETLAKFGKLDVLVNNAGVGGAQVGILSEQVMPVFDQVLNTNLRSVVFLTHLAAPHLVESKGNIVNISSIVSMSVLSSSACVYSTSKAGLDHFTRCVALELSQKGVRVNSVNPGPVKTDIITNMGATEAQAEVFYDAMAKSTALGKLGESEEIADLVLFLASDRARSITGSCFVSDNGALLKGTMER